MHVAMHWAWPSWTHGARMSWSSVTVLVREGLEVDGLSGVHFLAEAQQMEGGVGTDLVLHALENGITKQLRKEREEIFVISNNFISIRYSFNASLRWNEMR